jgi:hypothetical protein
MKCLVGNQFVNLEVLSLVGTSKAFPDYWIINVPFSFFSQKPTF